MVRNEAVITKGSDTIRLVDTLGNYISSGRQMQFHPAWLIVLLWLIPVFTSANEELENMPDTRMTDASKLMLDFAERTGLDSDRPPRRYLWTDAFAVCNYLGLAHTTGKQRYTELALRLIDQVHHILGRHRDDDPRSGWISGLSTQEGESHPTRGGLRIGKQLPERGAADPLDERLEWERDGQYFHYLTKWMHALDQASRSTGDPEFNIWARELAATAYDAFTYLPSPDDSPGMYWKMSIDLTHPLVSSMGQHDPIDGHITSMQLRATAAGLSTSITEPDLESTTRRFADMINVANMASPDPLGIGGLLVDAYRVAQLIEQGELLDKDLLEQLLTAAFAGLEYYTRSGELRAPAEYRLAFRELGLAIGLRAVDHMWQSVAEHRTTISPGVRAKLQALTHYLPLGDEIESFWLSPAHQDTITWSEHQDINEVMLATRLAPDGFLIIAPPD